MLHLQFHVNFLTFGRSCIDWVPPIAISEQSVTLTSLATNVVSGNSNYSNLVFIPLQAISGSPCWTSVETDFINEVYHRAIKCGKLMKYLPSKDIWK